MLLQCFSSSNIHQHRPIKRTVPGLREILFKSSLKKDWNGLSFNKPSRGGLGQGSDIALV